MKAVRIRKKLDSQVLDLPELSNFIGRTVDIIVLDEDAPENGKVDLAALDEIAGKDLIDETAFWELRKASLS